MKEYVIGVDIGATKSHLAVFDTEGNFTDLGHWGPLNYECLPGLYLQFEDEFSQFAKQVLEKNGISKEQVLFSVFGVGGVDTKIQHNTISEILIKHHFKNFTLINDAFLGIPAGTKNGTGICAINGSGCTIAGINKKGEMMQIGGVGAVSADMGGGAYMGERLVSAVYSELFRKGQPTLLTGLLFKRLGIKSKYDYIEKIHEKTLDGSFNIRECSPLIFEAAGQGDSVAAGILQEIAANYANGISCMIEEMHFAPEEELALVFAGSVFVKGEHPMLLETIKAKLRKDNPNHRLDFKLLQVLNVAGAVIWALNKVNNNGDFYEKVCNQLHLQ
jgi:N-acetylglucosamine kinase-like BadF-type ATPase